MTVQIHKRAFADCNVINADSIVVAVDVTELEANSTLNSESFSPITLRIFFFILDNILRMSEGQVTQLHCRLCLEERLQQCKTIDTQRNKRYH